MPTDDAINGDSPNDHSDDEGWGDNVHWISKETMQLLRRTRDWAWDSVLLIGDVPAHDWELRPKPVLKVEREKFLSLRGQRNGFAQFERFARQQGASDNYIEWYKAFDRAGSFLDVQAIVLATKHKLDTKRVRRLLERTSPHRLEDPLDIETVEDVLKSGLYLRPLLDRALEYLSPDCVLELFEQPDLTVLSQRALRTFELQSEELWTIDELAALTLELISYLEGNREHLIATGLPHSSLERSPWLAKLLGKLYYVKLPVEAEKTRPTLNGNAVCQCADGREDAVAQYVYEYKWARQRDLLQPDISSVGVRYCTYDEADYLQGLPRADIELITGMREKLFNLKLNVLSVIVECLQRGDAQNLWEKGFELIRDALPTSEEVELCIDMDAYYARSLSPESVHQTVVDNVGLDAGGLIDIIWAVWQFDEELTMGLHRRVRSELGDLVTLDELGRPHLEIDNYFQIIDTPRQGIVDNALDLYGSLKKQACADLESFNQRLVETMRQAYGEDEVLIRYKLNPQSAPSIEIESSGDDTAELLPKIMDWASQARGGASGVGTGFTGLELMTDKVLVIEDDGANITYYGGPLELPPRLQRALCALARRAGRWVSVDYLRNAVWDEDRITPIDDRAIRDPISHLHGRLKEAMPAKVRAQLKSPDDIIACLKGRKHQDTLYKLALARSQVAFDEEPSAL